MKKLIAVLLACVLLAALSFITGCGDDTTPPNTDGNGDAGNTGGNGDEKNAEPSPVSDFEFELNDDGNSYSVINYVGSDKNVIIPSSYLDKPVTVIGDGAFDECISLMNVVIPDSVTSIGENAFRGCGITSVTIGNGVTNIGDCAFEDCVKLIEVYDLSSLNITANSEENGYVGYYALNVYTATSGKSKLYTDENGYIFYKDGDTCYLVGYAGADTELVLPDGCDGKKYDIYTGAFVAFETLTSVKIPNSVTSICEGAFLACSGLVSITIPNGVTSIGDEAFSDCSSLTSVTIGNSVTSIGDWAFDDCHKLVEVYNLSSLNITAGQSGYGNVGRYALGVYTDINTPSKLWTNSDGYIFYENGNTCYLIGYTGDDTELTLPDSCNGKNYGINKYTFYGNYDITSITISNSVTSIGNDAFAGCTGLTEIQFNAVAMNDLSSNNYVFYNAGNNGDGIKVTIGKDVTRIPAYLFCLYYGNIVSPSNKIVSIKFEEGSVCKSIGNATFYDCRSLTSITIPDSVTSIGTYAFSGCSGLTSITIPNSVTSIGSFAFSYCSNLESITVAEGNSKYHSSGNCLIETESKTLILGCKNSIIPSDGSVTSIGEDAFRGCSSLTSITIPDSVMSIGDYTFTYCSSLTSITIPDSVTSIGSGAFYGCSGLTSITIPDSVTSIGDHAFYYGGSLTSVTIGNGVTRIGKNAFCCCYNLTSVTIGNSVTSIESSAFSECPKLVEVYNLSSLNIEAGDGKNNGYVGEYALDVYTDINTPSKLWTNSDGYIFYEDGDTCYLIGYTGDDTELTLPNSCNGKNYAINQYAFYNCSNITSVTIPNSVTSIGDAFNFCYSLTTINYTGSEEEWKAISKSDVSPIYRRYTINYNYTEE